MAKVEVPASLIGTLGAPMAMDIHWVDVKLKSGKVYRKLVVRNSRYITGRHCDPDGIGDIPFESDDIAAIRRQSIFPFWI
ncbi:hypothetical protein DDN83_15460 [Vibrio cholerae]|nr:hypothetical protein [Vibrio cholerae]GHW42866.1 hypothetical protein VCSRO10_3288 [Vibrio cholerae]GIB08991.1 hypothetical protein VCSRO137_0555 [Vibrio cholerae]